MASNPAAHAPWMAPVHRLRRTLSAAHRPKASPRGRLREKWTSPIVIAVTVKIVAEAMNYRMAEGVRIAIPLRGNHYGRQAARQDGFSLIEMMVVIGIMAIILAVALPAFSAWRESTALQSASETLMAHIKQARIMAVSGNRAVSITFAANSYTMDSGGTNPQVFQLSDYSKNLSMTSTAATLTFSSDGTTNAQDTITIKNLNGTIRTISVNLVGRAYIS
jgi:type IV fimbrial biogenesis protein FimT